MASTAEQPCRGVKRRSRQGIGRCFEAGADADDEQCRFGPTRRLLDSQWRDVSRPLLPQFAPVSLDHLWVGQPGYEENRDAWQAVFTFIGQRSRNWEAERDRLANARFAED